MESPAKVRLTPSRSILYNVLFLSPHRDDECLGAGGTLLKSDPIHIHYFNKTHPLVDQAVYDAEAEAVKTRLGCTVSYSAGTRVNQLGQQPLTDHIREIERWVNFIKPTTVFVPVRSRNQDHQVVYDAAMVALRPHDTNWYVPNVLLYEQHEYMVSRTRLNTFIAIDVGNKASLFKLYVSQQRGHRTPLHIYHLAGLRGAQCNQPFAEAFEAVRITL
jgi:LmbE family N-acetylglucosaminyl deacetylase